MLLEKFKNENHLMQNEMRWNLEAVNERSKFIGTPVSMLTHLKH